MARLLKNILSLALFFVVFYTALLFAVILSTQFTFKAEELLFKYNRLSDTHARRLQEFYKWLNKESTSKKGLILGSSTAYMNIDPMQLTEKTGVDFFNCGTSSQSIVLSEKILKDVVQNSKIDYLLLDVLPEIWTSSSLESSVIWVGHTPYPYSRSVLQIVKNENNVNLWNQYLYLLLKRQFSFSKYDVKPEQPDKVYKRKGYVYGKDAVRTEISTFNNYDKISAENAGALKNIVSICKNKNIKLIISIPKVLNADIDESLVRISGTCLINAENFYVDSIYLKDSYHMFYTGSIKYSEWLGDQLKDCIAKAQTK